MFYGATRGDAALPVRKIFWRQISLLGSTMGSPADWAAPASVELMTFPLVFIVAADGNPRVRSAARKRATAQENRRP